MIQINRLIATYPAHDEIPELTVYQDSLSNISMPTMSLVKIGGENFEKHGEKVLFKIDNKNREVKIGTKDKTYFKVGEKEFFDSFAKGLTSNINSFSTVPIIKTFVNRVLRKYTIDILKEKDTLYAPFSAYGIGVIKSGETPVNIFGEISFDDQDATVNLKHAVKNIDINMIKNPSICFYVFGKKIDLEIANNKFEINTSEDGMITYTSSFSSIFVAVLSMGESSGESNTLANPFQDSMFNELKMELGCDEFPYQNNENDFIEAALAYLNKQEHKSRNRKSAFDDFDF